ncbi:Zinc finger protein ZAT1 [Linum grandiflorum]
MKNSQPRECKICNRAFKTGKSMGGHMRSHLAKLPLPPKPYTPQPPPRVLLLPDPPAALSSSSPPSSTLINAVEDEDSYPTATRTRSTRRKRTPPPREQLEQPDQQVTSSGEDEAEVALCLLMMAYGGHGGGGKLYRCEKCNRGFGSYQALGGHRASHNKTGGRQRPVVPVEDDDEEEEEEEEDDDEDYHQIVDEDINRKMFKCSICDKVFESGQALGGHKKVHFNEMNKIKKKPRFFLSIDLNAPVPDEEDDDQQEVMSDAYRFSR